MERGRETPADQDEKKRGRILIFALDQLPSIFSTFLVNFLSSSEALRKWVRSSTSSLSLIHIYPNCGKTTLFNAYTGANLKVANWPGVTVEKKEGKTVYKGQEFKLIDLP